MTNYERQKHIYGMLTKVFFDKAYSGIVLNAEINKVPDGDKPFVTKVFYGVIEKNEYLTYAISSLAKSAPQPKIALVMKIGLYQLYFTSQSPYAVVSASVDLVKNIGKKEVAGFVNATLKNYDKVRFPDKSNRIKYLTVFGGVPEWLAKKLIAQLGFDFALDMLTAELPLKTHVRNNPVVVEKDEFGRKYSLTDKSAFGFYVTADELKKFAPDEYTVQSLSSIAAVNFYIKNLRSGSVLDVCAAPGGKSVLMAQSGDFSVTACDLHPHRTELIKKYASRMGVALNVELNDASRENGKWRNAFDIVICDVPCSGIGVIKSKPDILLNRKEADIGILCAEQSSILSVSAAYVKTGGRLCYSTCTVLYEENMRVIERFLQKNPGFEIDREDDDGIMELFPNTDKCDGFFVARLRRRI